MEAILVGKKEAAQALGISLRSLDYLLARGELTARRIGRRCLLERRELERWARRDHPTRKAAEGTKLAQEGWDGR